MPKREDMVPQPISPYGVSKLAAEQFRRGDLGVDLAFEVAADRCPQVLREMRRGYRDGLHGLGKPKQLQGEHALDRIAMLRGQVLHEQRTVDVDALIARPDRRQLAVRAEGLHLPADFGELMRRV